MVLLILVGPPIKHNLTIKLHLGIDKQSKIIRSELENGDPWFLEQRRIIFLKHNVIITDDEFREPTWQISSQQRTKFLPGTFRASGTFILSLRSIIEQDLYARRKPQIGYRWVPGLHTSGISFRKDPPPLYYPIIDPTAEEIQPMLINLVPLHDILRH